MSNAEGKGMNGKGASEGGEDGEGI